MDLKICDELILHVGSKVSIGLDMIGMTVHGVYLKQSYSSRISNTIEGFLNNRVKNQAKKEYHEFIHTNLYYKGFYEKHIYNNLRQYDKEYDVNYILDRVYVFDWSKIHKGIVMIVNDRAYDSGRLKIEYDFVNDTFSGNALDFAVKSHRAWDFVNKWFLLAQEQYKHGLSTKPYREIKKIQDFLKDKKTVRKYLGNGEEVKISNVCMSYIFDDRWDTEKVEVISLRHGTKHLKVNHDLVRTTMGYVSKSE